MANFFNNFLISVLIIFLLDSQSPPGVFLNISNKLFSWNDLIKTEMTSRSKWPRKLIKTVKESDVGVWKVLYKLAKRLSWLTKHYPNSWSSDSWFESWRVLYRVLCYPSESSGFTFAHPSQLKFTLNLTFNSSVLSALRLTLEGPSGSSPAIRCFGDGLHVGS